MFRAFQRNDFHSKCKSGIGKSRIQIGWASNNKKTTEKNLRNDVAGLLRERHVSLAYDRAVVLISAMNESSCYDFVIQCLDHISTKVSDMDKQSECPEDCREAVASILYGTERLPRLFELRNLRDLLFNRYGQFLESSVNKQFKEKMSVLCPPKDSIPQLPSKDSILKLLGVIAQSSDLDWDPNDLETKLLHGSSYDEHFAKKTDDSDCSSHSNMDNSVRRKDHLGTAYELKQRRESDPQAKYRPTPPAYTNATNKEKAEQKNRILVLFYDDGQRDDEEKQYSSENGSSSDGKGNATKHKTTNRVTSLRTGPVPSPPPEASSKYTRSSSLQPELSRRKNSHVHPNMPDYEDLVADLAALGGNSN